MADVAGAAFVQRAARPSSDPVNVLVALWRILGEVDPSAEHPADVGVTFVKAFMDDGIDERRAWEEVTIWSIQTGTNITITTTILSLLLLLCS